MAETGVCGELEKDEDELAQVLGDCPRAAAEERAVGMAIVDDMAVDDTGNSPTRG